MENDSVKEDKDKDRNAEDKLGENKMENNNVKKNARGGAIPEYGHLLHPNLYGYNPKQQFTIETNYYGPE